MNKKKIDTFQYIHPDTVFIDNITLTYSPKNNSDKDHILKAVGNDGWLETWAKLKYPKKEGAKKYLSASKHYQTSIALQFPDDNFTHDNTALLEINPWVKSTGFLRLEYNP